MKISLTRSALLHLRLPFSVFLLPVFLFAFSQTPDPVYQNVILIFIAWHLLVYPASNGYNSYFDKDESSIALIEKPPKVEIGLYYLSILLQVAGFILACFVSTEFAVATVVYSLLSDAYSHPIIRLKKYPFVSFLIVFIFQGAFIYWTSYAAMSDLSIFSVWSQHFILAGLTSSFLVGASYPITQIYQFEEDSRRGDKTLALLLGYRGSFIFSGVLFVAAAVTFYLFWARNNLFFYELWLFFALPVALCFFVFAAKVWKNTSAANFRNVMGFVILSSVMMLFYFAYLALLKVL